MASALWIERLGLGVPALGVIVLGQVAEAPGHVGMVRAEHPPPERERVLIQRLGAAYWPWVYIAQGQVVEALGHVGMVGAEGLVSPQLGAVQR